MKPLADLLGESPAIEAVRAQMVQILERQRDSSRLPPILIQGETGTGKGLLARLIHRGGPRRDGPFVSVNCAAIPAALLEAEMFGFERGAFTDARRAKPGLFQAAHRGTIFLDEVGLLSEPLQAKLLKVIEERMVRRLGSTRDEPVDVWILTATNEDLRSAIAAQRFREDLYHRLAILTLSLPPLRQRGADVVALAEHLLARACADYGVPPRTLAPDARTRLGEHRWPGNVRELANVIERAVLMSNASEITAEVLGLEPPPAAEPPPVERAAVAGTLDDTIRDHLLEVLQGTGWNLSRTAAALGISRNTLRARIAKYGLRAEDAAPAEPRRPVARPLRPPAAVEDVPPAPSVPRRWERRRLALLRASLLAPPEAEAPLAVGPTLDLVIEKARAFGGRIEGVSPLAMLAVFGLDAIGDAPRRAALAAIAVRNAIARARREEGSTIGVREAIHVGQFLVGHVGETAELDIGARSAAWGDLESLVERAEPDGVMASAAAAAFLRRDFSLAPAAPSDDPGAQAYVLSGPEARAPEPGPPMATFVGRQHELELLLGRLESSMAGQGQVVGIVGEAGIGKSRLLLEFRRRVGDRPVTWLEGHCFSYGSAIPYLPLVGVVRSLCGVDEADGPEAIVEKVAEPATPYLLRLFGIKAGTERLEPLSSEAINTRTQELLRQLTLQESQRQPLILVVEDIHWIDRASETYLDSLIDALAGARILLLLTCRPGHRSRGMEKSYATQIALQPLSPSDSLSVLCSVLPAVPVSETVTQLILARAEGNPFFLEELSRAVSEHGELRGTLAVPDTIEEVLLTRLDRLPAESRRLLQTASVLGREVSLRLLDALWDGPDGVEACLGDLTRLEFLHERAGTSEPGYVFKHALTQEAVYGSVPEPERRALHAAAARALERFYAGRLGEVVDRLAHHYARTDDAEKAIEYLTTVAAGAARGHAHAEAVAALQAALPHVERLPDGPRERRRPEVALSLNHSLFFLGQFQRAAEILLEQREGVERLGDPGLTGRYYFQLGHTWSLLGEHDEAVRCEERALDEATRCGDRATAGKAYYVLARDGFWSGQPRRGVEHGRQAVAALEATEERWWLGMAHWASGIDHAVMGEFEAALAAQAEAHAIGEAIGDPRLQSYAAWTTGAVYAARGEAPAAIAACTRGLEHSPDPINTANALGFLGYAHLEAGDAAEATPLLEQAVDRLHQFGARQGEGWFTAWLSEARLLAGRVDEARALALRGLEITTVVKFLWGSGVARRALGRVARAQGALDEAGAHLHDALRVFGEIDARFDVARTHLALAELAGARGRPAEAAGLLAEARRLFGEIGVPRFVERADALARQLGIVP
ncbi:MAG TPA: hypothetical protein DDZ42_22420 [Candidatus Rokubacteria bacterium]|nr:MAG: hypothetical protein A2050_01740 [Candidatus Rokubacteria bacterium GWA2_73_35]HBH04632.1 hypothetical protein [Candidatus Rokubacteria bacterium]